MTHFSNIIKTPLGNFIILVDSDGILLWLYGPIDHKSEFIEKNLKSKFDSIVWSPQKCAHVTRQISEYFNKKRKSFDLIIKPDGTDFQIAVWNELTRIPFGTTINYGELALRVGNPKASRAVGQANRKNPIMIVIPCHRVIQSDGKVTGPDSCLIRKLLLDHEEDLHR